MPRVAIGDDVQNPSPVLSPPLENLIGISSSGPTISSQPTVSSQPTGGHGVALTDSGTLPTSAAATAIQVLTSDPSSPAVGQIWYRIDLSKLCIRHDASTTKTIGLV